jgi:hypothetical protein
MMFLKGFEKEKDKKKTHLAYLSAQRPSSPLTPSPAAAHGL